MTNNGKIGTYKGIDFYTSLDEMLNDGKELFNLEDTKGTQPQLVHTHITDSTGKIASLKEKLGKEYESLLEAMTLNEQEKSAIITWNKERAINDSSVIAIYDGGDTQVTQPFFAIKDGYHLAQANMALPYTIQRIK